jgi:hypothetical protein
LQHLQKGKMMTTRWWRLALTGPMFWIGFGVSGQAEAGGIALSSPAGLSPGESFRFAFVTAGTTVATSPNIADYNSFVNAQAAGATFNGSVVTWNAVASTSTINAIDNIGQSQVPVYLVDGTLVSTSTTITGLWSGSLTNPIDLDLNRVTLTDVGVWTGSSPDGTADPVDPLGDPVAIFGFSSRLDAQWISADSFDPTFESHLYGVSQLLTDSSAVPEPSTLLLAGTAITLGLAIAMKPPASDRTSPRSTRRQ